MSTLTKVVKVSVQTDKLLTELSKKRKEAGSLVRTKQDILSEAITALYKREMR